MIKANELRIWNWIEHFGSYIMADTIQYMVGYYIISGANNKYKIPHHTNNADAMNPIPLTPEILEKAGFVNCSCGGFKSAFLHLDKRDGGIYYNSTLIKHLHQLQNLYFALTGEELNVQL